MHLQEIIEIKPEDLQKYACLWNIKGKEEKLCREMLEGKRKMFVYFDEEVLIGGVSLVFDSGDFNRTIPPERAYLSYLVIMEGYRNQGFGSSLIDNICEYARQSGISEITLRVEHSNPRAKKLYLAKGFNEVILEASDSILLLKRL